jgi:GNAT superfamily N-acetyltransferase
MITFDANGGGMRVRPVKDGDWPAVVALESSVYDDGLSEDPDALASRGRASPATSFVLDTGTRLAGYLLALPYPEDRFPTLTRAETVVFRSTNLHLHDIVVARELRGRGLAGRLLRHLDDASIAAGFERISLVAVAGSAGFWRARGFLAYPRVAVPACYGTDAVYMYTKL